MDEETITQLATKIQATAGKQRLKITDDAAVVAASNVLVARAMQSLAKATAKNGK